MPNCPSISKAWLLNSILFIFNFFPKRMFHIFITEPHRLLVKKPETSGAKHSISPISCSDNSDVLTVTWLLNTQVILTHSMCATLYRRLFVDPASFFSSVSFHSNPLRNGTILLLFLGLESLDPESLVKTWWWVSSHVSTSCKQRYCLSLQEGVYSEQA